MRSKLLMGLVLAVVVGLVASPALADKLLCVSKKSLKGEMSVSQCLAKGERFAIVDDSGIVHILTPEEVELTKAFNPKVFETRAFGIQYQKLAPKVSPLAVPKEAN
ncbi:MAG: succinylglutamate desuccinylase [Deltaproteobacteria bacterium]|nr:succinylglutamate desuccinylase [Deltaproteobacteria bacterium]MBW1952945.1 succinylglutamate desuccinylase [Deltaproteobacteria bacterium]MBW1986453.1 succinylglutamate desuccinylase [Deltaproteobacteria bacterium]MBW2135544.1 succinylglutamate desuccinylase [Deltaproteobacteria bacterium]